MSHRHNNDVQPLPAALANLFVIGASKCGTTFMHGMLDQHPQISMCPTKEPRFFQQPDCLDKLADYERLYAPVDGTRYYGEASPSYSETTAFPHTVQNLHTYNSQARIIYIVREPLSRLASVWVQAQSTGHWAKSGD